MLMWTSRRRRRSRSMLFGGVLGLLVLIAANQPSHGAAGDNLSLRRITDEQYRQIIQGVTDGTIISREEIPPFRKDVLAKMSGGDVTRKNKLLDKQKKGKAKMLTTTRVDIPQEALLSMIERS